MEPVQITLNDQERAAFHQLIDAALRYAGGGALDVAAHFKNKLREAEALANERNKTNGRIEQQDA